MTRRRTQSPYAPLAAWLGIYMKTAEMLASSAHVIGHRTGRMLLAGPNPGRADRREFALMGREKVAASYASSSAMAASLLDASLRLWSRTLATQLDTIAATAALASSRTAAQAMTRHATLVRAMARSPLSASASATTAARVIARGIAPVHARATANSRRLSKR